MGRGCYSCRCDGGCSCVCHSPKDGRNGREYDPGYNPDANHRPYTRVIDVDERGRRIFPRRSKG